MVATLEIAKIVTYADVMRCTKLQQRKYHACVSSQRLHTYQYSRLPDIRLPSAKPTCVALLTIKLLALLSNKTIRLLGLIVNN